MKVIDLLNKIAKGEEIPKKILCDGIVYTYNPKQGDYYEIDSPISLFLYENFGNSPSTKIWLLSDNIEILEDKTEEIEEIQADDNYCIHTELGSFKGRKMDIAFVNKFNELVRAINQIKKDFLAIGVDYRNDCDKETNCMTD